MGIARRVLVCVAAALSFGAMCESKQAPLCPNGSCDHGMGETLRNCPQDCASLCGNHRCDLGIENASSCPDDCGCGDGRCQDTETPNTCQADCRVGCGDQVCAPWDGEDIGNCPIDCQSHCGDGHCDWQNGESYEEGVCETDCGGGCDGDVLGCSAFGPCGDGFCDCSVGENHARCPGDCGGSESCSNPPTDKCGNGACEATFGESPSTCPVDCWCGDGECDQLSETGRTCPQDCKCGNGTCETAQPYRETSLNCPADCDCEDGVCAGNDLANCPADCYCGDTVCDRTEDPGSCPDDCYCGDGQCQAPESHASCARDCTCGDGKCAGGESPASCPQDCEATPEPDPGTPDASTDAAVAGNPPSITSIYPPGNATSGQSGQFSAIVSDSPTRYAWDFGGGASPNSSTAMTPSVTFGAPGDYTVSLTVSNDSGTSALYSTSYTVGSVQGNAPVISSVSQTGYLGATGTIINFNAGATNADGATWVWDFGTGATLYGASQQFSTITLASPGLHHGSVTATTAGGSGTLDFVFLVSSTPINPPTFQSFSVASAPLTSLPPSAILLGDGRPLVAYATAANHIAVSVADSVAPSAGSSFIVHEVDATPTAPPRALSTALLAGAPVVAYLFPDGADLVLAVSMGAVAPTQSSDWTRHDVLRIAGAAAGASAAVALASVADRLVMAVVSAAGLQMAFAQTASPTASSDWAIHLLDGSSTLTDCALGSLDGAVVGYLDGAGALRFASAAVDPPTQMGDWSVHTIETFTGMQDVSLTVMGSSVVLSTTGASIFGIDHVHRASVADPASASDWEMAELGSAFGRHSITTVDGRLAIASMTATTSAVPFASRTVLADQVLVEAWQFRQLTTSVTNPLLGDAFGLTSGRLAFCYVDAAAGGNVMVAQANAPW